jgi:CheY-like chemotaxis protein
MDAKRVLVDAKRILVVDDDDDLRRSLRDVLEEAGYQVIEARDGREALAELRRTRPGLVLLDVMMPDMDGYQFRAEQRATPDLADVPVVILSAGRPPARGSELGSDRFVQKPITARQLIELVAEYIGG